MKRTPDAVKRTPDAALPDLAPVQPLPIFRPHGQVAQLVEQRTENPRVGGSIPSLAIHCNIHYPVLSQGPSEFREALLVLLLAGESSCRILELTD